jgi:hypothetical protein
MKSKVTYDFSKLHKFIRGLESNLAVDVGIMGAKNKSGQQTKIRRDGGGINNPTLGFIHEFGRGVPIRSFLRMPLTVKADGIIKDVVEAGALKKFAEGDVWGVMSDLGFACETAIGEAFDTAGFGDWGHSYLTDTGQLRRSIASQVVQA